MSRLKNNFKIIYSTNPDFRFEETEVQPESAAPSHQKLVIRLDRKKRKGKQVTLITGFTGSQEELRELARTLKSKCGVGGTARDGEIIIQGDFRNKTEEMLTEMGHTCKVIG